MAYRKREPRRAGFTLVELLVVLGIVLILAGMLAAAAMMFRRRMLREGARLDVANFIIALSAYNKEFRSYPPDNVLPPPGGFDTPDENGVSDVMNEVLVYYLGRKHKVGVNHYGPYVQFNQKRLKDDDEDGFQEYLDPYGNLYFYAENASEATSVGQNPRSYDLVTAGDDGRLGGDMTAAGGFVPSGSEEDREDNITNWSN